MADLPPLPPNIAHITATLLLSVLWNWCLYGVLMVQFYVYSYNFPEDKRSIKFLVCFVFFLETVQTGLSGADVYYWFVSGYGDIRHLAFPFAAAFDVPIIESVVSLIVEFFFAHRIWALGVKWAKWFCLFICLFSILNAAAAFAGGIYAHIHRSFASGEALRRMAITWLIGNTMADILIASALLYHLVKRHRDTRGFYGDHALVKIVRLTIETNLLTTSVGIVSLVLVVLFPNENWYTCPTAILGKLYSNTLLASLNNRISIREVATTRGIANRTEASTLGRTRFDSNTDIAIVGIKQPSETYKSSGIGGV